VWYQGSWLAGGLGMTFRGRVVKNSAQDGW
jgi:hypothetical protein